MTWLMEILKNYLEDQLLIKAFNTAKNPKHDEYQLGLASVVCKFLMKKNFR